MVRGIVIAWLKNARCTVSLTLALHLVGYQLSGYGISMVDPNNNTLFSYNQSTTNSTTVTLPIATPRHGPYQLAITAFPTSYGDGPFLYSIDLYGIQTDHEFTVDAWEYVELGYSTIVDVNSLALSEVDEGKFSRKLKFRSANF